MADEDTKLTDTQMRIKAIEMATAAMANARPPAEGSAQYAGNLFSVVNNFYGFMSGKVDRTGLVDLDALLSKK